MQITKTLMFTMALLSPAASYAFTSDDVRIQSMIKDHQAVVQDYATMKQKPMPQIVLYKYGMSLDIASVVRLSPELKTCKVVPQLMTYEDSTGKLNTVQYQILGACPGKH